MDIRSSFVGSLRKAESLPARRGGRLAAGAGRTLGLCASVSVGLVFFAGLLGRAAEPAGDKSPGEVYTIVIHDLPAAESVEYPEFQDWLRAHPRARAQRVTSLKISSVERGGLLMSIAGGIAPDLLRVYHHEAKSWVRNGFFAPLDKYIYRDTNGDGRYTHGVDEVIWKPFLNIPDRIREEFILEDGHIYYLPRFQWAQFFVYRRDIFAAAGLDPDKRFETFDEMKRACRIITDPQAKIPGARLPRGRFGMGLSVNGWIFQGYLYAMGGRSVVTLKACPGCHEEVRIEQGQLVNACPHCGADLRGVKGREQAAFNSPEGLKALQFWQDLMWAPFVKAPGTGEPVEVGKPGEDLHYPFEVTDPTNGKKFTIENEKQVIFGCAKRLIDEDANGLEQWANGEVAMLNAYTLDPLLNCDIDPSVVGVMPIPEGGGASGIHYYGIYSGVKDRQGGEDRVDVCARMILDFVSQFYVAPDSPDYLKYRKAYARHLVKNGFYRLCTYEELKAAGLDEYAREIPPAVREMRRLTLDPDHYTFLPISEGYSRVQNEIFGYVLLSQIAYDPKCDLQAALDRATSMADSQVFMKDEMVKQIMGKYNLLFTAVIVLLLGGVGWAFARVLLRPGEVPNNLREAKRLSLGKRAASLLLLLPAVGLILLWAYYPLLRGSVMAFQEVRIMGASRFVGFENFVRVVTNPLFPSAMKATFIYVLAVLSLGFMAPVFLAVFLSEIKWGSTALRAIYYSPYLRGGVVVLFIWKIFYMPTDEGLFNHLLSQFGLGPVRWLQDPAINKWCIAIPGIWAGTGSACLVYLAAIKGIDDSLYEAADIDGAGPWHKLFSITIPSLKPLLVINFVGAFIGAFHSMGNILVLTGGAYETNVIGLQIFLEAFSYLRFGPATALAWILGSMLIGFTIYQLNFLRKVEFRRSQ